MCSYLYCIAQGGVCTQALSDEDHRALQLTPTALCACLCRYLVPDPVPWWQVPLLKAASVFLKTPKQGAATSIYLASSPEVEGVSSKYWVDCKPKASNKASYDTDVARKLWEVSQELTGAPISGEVAPVPAAQQA